MSQVTDQPTPSASTETDLATAIQRVMAASEEPLTVSKLKAKLPANLRPDDVNQLTEMLRQQVASGKLQQYPPYRSQQDRYWDRPMPVHVAMLLRVTLEEGPLPWSHLRRKLPAYALAQAEQVLQEQVAQGKLHQHPRGEGRTGERFGVRPPNAKDYLKQEMSSLFNKLEQMGFNQSSIRGAAIEVLHDEEWAPTPPAPAKERSRPEQPNAPMDDSDRPPTRSA